MLITLLTLATLATPARPEITLAQAHIESHGNAHAIGKAGERGAWQVRPKIWGAVPADLHGQQMQNERIMEELMRANKGDLEKSLIRYNGKGKQARRYAKRVILAAVRVALLGRA